MVKLVYRCVPGNMKPQLAFMSKASAIQITMVASTSRDVILHMSLKVTFSEKLRLTVVTVKLVYPCVPGRLKPHMVFVSKALVTQFTVVSSTSRDVTLHMSLQVTYSEKIRLTVVTVTLFYLFYPCLPGSMKTQLAFMSIATATLVTQISPFV